MSRGSQYASIIKIYEIKRENRYDNFSSQSVVRQKILLDNNISDVVPSKLDEEPLKKN